ncbi:MAG TPA: hypothetical protein VGR26_10910, partial [Acidimicrobiales bacterium]|nr:hypothetical protein [Acidimicrobiales bacterium]
FVVAVLNDLFGIQSRGGCSCAGPYGHRLLGIDVERSHRYERAIASGCEGIKPGWVRVNFNYFISEAVFDFLLQAVHLVAEHAWRLLPDYRFDPRTGIWRHHLEPSQLPLSLHGLRYDEDGTLSHSSAHVRAPEGALRLYLEEAGQLLAKTPAFPLDGSVAAGTLSADFEALRWFELPSQCLVETDEGWSLERGRASSIGGESSTPAVMLHEADD